MSGAAADGERVAEEIRAAFAGAAYPGDDRLVPPTPRRDPERAQIAADFAGRAWGELGVAFLRERPEALLLMTPEAFRFYLPAYLLAMVLQPRASDLVPAAVLQSLTPPPGDSPGTADWFAERVEGFTPQQRRAIRTALEHATVVLRGFLRREPDRALAYWSGSR